MGSEGSSRLDTLETKALIHREIGHQRAESYFDQLGKFFTLKITKSEFDKFCIKTIGRRNIHLHNRLISSILKNASVAKSPPSRFPKKGGNFIRFGSNGNPKQNQIQQPLYRDSALSPSTRKCRSRKFKDRPSPLGKPHSLTTTNEESLSKVQRATELLSLGSRPPMEVASVEEGEEVEQIAASPSVQSRSPVTAPFGVSLSRRNGVTRKSISNVSTSCISVNRETCQSSGELPHTRTLRDRLERILEKEGLKISMDSVSLLNNGLDVFMKRLIEPCLSLANTPSGNEPVREMNYQYTQPSRRLIYVSMSDFRAGMELNPQILGEDWPIHMEKICSRASDE